MKTVDDVLHAALTLLSREQAWGQGDDLSLRHGPWDLILAIVYVAPGRENVRLRAQAYPYLRKAIGSRRRSLTPLIDFNDTPGRTHGEIVAVVRRAWTLAVGDLREEAA